MKSIANRLIVLAASALAFGTVAFGQTRLTAEIPFAFHTATGNMPAGTYEIREASTSAASHMVLLRNAASQKSAFIGNPTFNVWRTAASPVVEFACVNNNCSLKAIRTSSASLEYLVPKVKDDSYKVAVISIPLKSHNAD